MTRRLSIAFLLLLTACALTLGTTRTARAAPAGPHPADRPAGRREQRQAAADHGHRGRAVQPPVRRAAALRGRDRRQHAVVLERPAREAGRPLVPLPLPGGERAPARAIAGADTLTTFVDKAQWGKAQTQPNVGTAWLVSVDASSGMGGRFGDARAIAHELIESMRAERPDGPDVLRRRAGRQRHQVDDLRAQGGPGERAERVQVDRCRRTAATAPCSRRSRT